MPEPKGTERKERTLTAVRSPFADGEMASVPLLVEVGSARAGGPAPGAPGRRWWILPAPSAQSPGTEIAFFARAGSEAAAAAAALPVALVLVDPLISGRHARLSWGPEGLVIEDLGSKNGTFLAGARLAGPAVLPEGALLFLGEHAFLHRMVSPHALLALEEEAGAPLGPVATASAALALTAEKLRRWAGQGELLLCGETGVGKEIYARAVHGLSGRRGPFVPVNCAALPRELVESELFGYRAGAHSTARADRPGLIERAAGGTLFLDEIGELPQEGQAKLLRFLQDRELAPLGGRDRPRKVEVAVLAATNRPVAGQGGALRADLVGRLGAAPVLLPPLRERREDLGVLARFFLERSGFVPDGQVPAFEIAAFRALCQHEFPLNVRELEKLLGAAFALTRGARPIALRDLPAGLGRAPDRTASPPVAAAPVEKPSRRSPSPAPSAAELESLLAQHQGNVAEVSRVLGRQRAAVWRWIKRFGLGVDRHRGE